MKVTPVGKKFGKYAPGVEFDLPDKAAKVFIKVGKLKKVEASAPTYQTRMMQAEPAASVVASSTPDTTALAEDSAPYGYKIDGTPRKRPGRPVSE